MVVLIVPHGEERTQRAFRRGHALPVSVHAQHQLAEPMIVGRHEHFPDAAAADHIHQRHGFVGRQLDEGAHLPALAQMDAAPLKGRSGSEGTGMREHASPFSPVGFSVLICRVGIPISS